MDIGNVDIPLSIIATTLAVASFCGGAWRLWRDRPRLVFYVRPVTFTNVPKTGSMKLVRFMICNVGYRPIVLMRFMALGEKNSFSMGLDDEPAAALGVEDQRFPTLLNPGQSLKIHPLEVGAIERNGTDPEDKKVFYDPWRCFVFVDSFGRLYPIDADDVRSELHFRRMKKPEKGLLKIWQKIDGRLFLRRAKKKWLR